MKSPQLGMLIKYYVNDSCKAAKQPDWYFKPILFRSDSINMKGNQVFFVWLKWLRFCTKDYIRDKLKLLYEFMSYNHCNLWVVFSALMCVLKRIRILRLGCERLKNDYCDTCTDNLSLFVFRGLVSINNKYKVIWCEEKSFLLYKMESLWGCD